MGVGIFLGWANLAFPNQFAEAPPFLMPLFGGLFALSGLLVIAQNVQRMMVMYGGKVVEKAPTRVLFSHMKMPYTEALFQSIPKIEDPSHTRLNAIAGRPPDLVNPPRGCPFSPRCPNA